MSSLVRNQAVEATMLGDMVVMLANGSEKEAVFSDPKHIGLALILGHDPTELVSVTLKAHFETKANRFLVDMAVDQRIILQVEIPKGERYSIGFTKQVLDKLAEANHE